MNREQLQRAPLQKAQQTIEFFSLIVRRGLNDNFIKFND